MSGRRSFPLVVHLSTLFGVLIVATTVTLTWVGFERSKELIEADGEKLAEQGVEEIGLALSSLSIPVELGVSLIGEHPINEETTWQGRLAHFSVFAAALQLAKPLRPQDTAVPVYAYFVGYRNGDFFLVRRILTEEQRRYFDVDQDVHYIVQSIDWEDGVVDGRFIYLDENGEVLRNVPMPDYAASYDPRYRTWYRKALVTIGISRTDPYIFQTTGALGVTFAARSSRAITVVGADLDLRSAAEFLARQKPTPSSRVVLTDRQGRIFAADDVAMITRLGSDGQPEMATIDGFPTEEIRALAARGEISPNLQRFEVSGEPYFGLRYPLVGSDGRQQFLLITIPEGELLAEAYVTRQQMLLLSSLVFLVAVAATLLASYSISRSLAKLSRAADRFRQFDFDTPLTNNSIVAEVRRLTDGFISLRDTLQRYNHLLFLISREKDLTSLQPTILGELSAVLEAEKAVLYVVPQQIDGLVAVASKNGDRIEMLEADKDAADALPSLVGETLSTGRRGAVAGRVRVEEMGLPGLSTIEPGGAAFDHALCYPLRDRKDEVNGAILFLDCEKAGEGARALVGALTGAAALSLESRQLIASEKALFQSFITLIAGAIDAKSPYTGGHCARVPELTKMLAQVAVESQEGPFSDFDLSEDQWEAVHVAAWLHDCGKVTSPEFVVDKATKLETIYDRIHEVRMRFEVLKRDAEIARVNAVLAGANPAEALAKRDAEWRDLDEDFAFVARCNEGGEFLSDEHIDRLRRIGQRCWTRTLDDSLGTSDDERSRKQGIPQRGLPIEEPLLADRPDHIVERPAREVLASDNPWGFRMDQPVHLYNRGELHNLSVRRGTLSEEERYKINDHIVQTIIMLSALPYPKHLREVPELAGGHHERIDGAGYPRRLTGEQMSPVARMMAIADIFEALTATDRPYKKGKPLSVAVKIMSGMAKEGHVDPDLFNLFLESGIHRSYAARFMAPEQVDDVRVEDFLVDRSGAQGKEAQSRGKNVAD